MEYLRYIIGSAFLLIGMIIFLIEVMGIFRLKCALNRMHATAMGDTLGLASSILGIMIFSGLNFTTLKMALVVVFLWFTSPVASHLIARLELLTYDELSKNADIYDDVKELEAEIKTDEGGEC